MGGRKLALRQLCQVARTQLRCFSTSQPALAGFEGREGEPMPAIKAPEGPNGVIHVGSLQSLHWPPIGCIGLLCLALHIPTCFTRLEQSAASLLKL